MGLSLGPALNYASMTLIPGLGGGYEPEAAALFARMTVPPDAARRQALNAFIRAAKAGGWWSRLDALYLLAAHDAQAARLNIVGEDSLTAVGSPVFTVDRGYRMDGSTTHLNTNINPTTAGRHYSLNAGSMGFYSRTNQSGPILDMGVRESPTLKQSVVASMVSGSHNARMNIDGGALVVAGSSSLGHFVGLRESDTSRIFVNGVEVASIVAAPTTALYPGTVYIGGVNQFGAPTARTLREYAAVHIGSLTTSHMTSLNDALNTYLTAIGANV